MEWLVFEDSGKSGFLFIIKMLEFVFECSFLVKRKMLLFDRFWNVSKDIEVVCNVWLLFKLSLIVLSGVDMVMFRV